MKPWVTQTSGMTLLSIVPLHRVMTRAGTQTSTLVKGFTGHAGIRPPFFFTHVIGNNVAMRPLFEQNRRVECLIPAYHCIF